MDLFQPYSWFGYSVHAKEGLLMVGQPNFRKCAKVDCSFSVDDVQALGRMNLYNLEYKHDIPGLTLTGPNRFDMAGASADVGYPYDNTSLILAVGIPGKTNKNSKFYCAWHLYLHTVEIAPRLACSHI